MDKQRIILMNMLLLLLGVIITMPQYVLHHVKFLPVAANDHHEKGIDMYLELCIVGGQNEMQMK